MQISGSLLHHLPGCVLITSELKGLMKKLSFNIPPRYYIKCKIASSFFNHLLHYSVCRYGLHYNAFLGLMIT